MTDASSQCPVAQGAGTEAAATRSVEERLRDVRVGLRGDVDVIRHRFGDGPSYVLRDPISFATFRLDATSYRMFVSLDERRTLGETFAGLVSAGACSTDDAEDFYTFILELQRAGLLSLPVNDADALHQRAVARRASGRRSKAMGFLFLRIPLVDPDRLLARTAPLVGWLFTRWALAAWCALVGAAAWVLATRWSEFQAPALTMITGSNLLLLWALLIGLKVVHEFGHAWACRCQGGSVPEMGAYLILFTPCAYVDATDSWRFAERTRRIIVALGGVYFESIVGAIAVFVWAFTDPGTLHTLAWQTITLSTVTTILFNLNPLMRYDGYYIVSDLSGVPNLRERAQRQATALVQFVVTGYRQRLPRTTRHKALALIGFGTALAVYRVVLVLTICALIATQFFFVGLALAAFFVAISTMGIALKTLGFITSPRIPAFARVRAAAFVLFTLAGLPLLAGVVDLPERVDAPGVVRRAQETILRAPEPGLVTRRPRQAGLTVAANEVVVGLTDPALDEALLDARLAMVQARIALHAAERDQDSEVAVRRVAHARRAAELEALERRAESLAVRAPSHVDILTVTAPPIGSRVEPGTELALVGSGGFEALFLLDERDVLAAGLEPGSIVPVRAAADPTRLVRARVLAIDPIASRAAIPSELTGPQDADIAIDASGSESIDARFTVRVRLDPADWIARGGRLRLAVSGEPRSLGTIVSRSIRTFFERLAVHESS